MKCIGLRRSVWLASVASLALVGAGCGDDIRSSQEVPTIAELVAEDESLSILEAALQRADLIDTLGGAGPFTVFAPTDEAFARSGITSIADFGQEQLREILLYHVIEDAWLEADGIEEGPVDTAAGLSVFLHTNGGVTVNGGAGETGGAGVIRADVVAENGIVHVVDRVLLPPNILACARYAGFSSLLGAVEGTADLASGPSVLEALRAPGPITVFAPTNSAFAAADLPEDATAVRDILLYHTLSDRLVAPEIPLRADSMLMNAWGNGVSLVFDDTEGLQVNDARVSTANIKCTNGIVHAVDSVLLPPSVIDMAGHANLTSFVNAASEAVELPDGVPVAETLTRRGPYTVFAPNNEAFASITLPNNPGVVREILLLHVLNADTPILSSELPDEARPLLPDEMLNFDSSVMSVSSDGTPRARIILPDLNVTNGVVHVIDEVLFPE